MAKFDEKEFKKHISSKKFNNTYIIYGDEKYLVKFYTKELTKKLVGDEPPEFSFHEFGAVLDPNQLMAAVGAVPFMTEYTCVLVNDLIVSKLTKDEFESILTVIDSVPDSTVLIFSYPTRDPLEKNNEEKEDDKKAKKPTFRALIKAVEKKGAVAEINQRSATSLEHQISAWADKLGKKISLPVASRIIFYAGTDLSTLHSELNKLCAFAGEEDEITNEMVEKTVIKKLEARVYDLVDNVIYGNMEKAYSGLHQLFALKEDPRDILRVLSYSYVDLYRARVTLESGQVMKETAEYFKYESRAWVLTKAVKKADRLSTNALRESLSLLADLNEKFNSTTLNEHASLEKLIANLFIIAKRELDYA